jgi:hypothetical protein
VVGNGGHIIGPLVRSKVCAAMCDVRLGKAPARGLFSARRTSPDDADVIMRVLVPAPSPDRLSPCPDRGGLAKALFPPSERWPSMMKLDAYLAAVVVAVISAHIAA